MAWALPLGVVPRLKILGGDLGLCLDNLGQQHFQTELSWRRKSWWDCWGKGSGSCSSSPTATAVLTKTDCPNKRSVKTKAGFSNNMAELQYIKSYKQTSIISTVEKHAKKILFSWFCKKYLKIKWGEIIANLAFTAALYLEAQRHCDHSALFGQRYMNLNWTHWTALTS